MTKECLAIQKAIGEKFGGVLMALAMCVAGLTFGFTKGWSLVLALLGAVPPLAFISGLFFKVIQGGFK